MIALVETFLVIPPVSLITGVGGWMGGEGGCKRKGVIGVGWFSGGLAGWLVGLLVCLGWSVWLSGLLVALQRCESALDLHKAITQVLDFHY